MKKILILLSLLVLVGCEQHETIPVIDYHSTNNSHSRFTVVSAEYYRIDSLAQNFQLTVLRDTQGTNDLLVITTPSAGPFAMAWPKPVKQLEDNR